MNTSIPDIFLNGCLSFTAETQRRKEFFHVKNGCSLRLRAFAVKKR